MYCVAIELTAKPGLAEDVITLSPEYIPIVTAMPGCLRFELNQSPADTQRFLLYELYESREALIRHCGDELFRRWRPRIAALEQSRTLVEYDCLISGGHA
jgi:quinol monooxygenase YgiN